MQLEQISGERTLNDMLVKGEIDAFIGARQPFGLVKHQQVQRLFPDYRSEERRFFQKTGIFPIMHTLVMKEELYQQHPWVAESLFKAWEESKGRALQNMRFSGTLRYMLPWLFADIEELDGMFGGDPFPSGLDGKANRVTVSALQQYLMDQGFVKDQLPLEELFAPIVLSNE